MRLVFLHRLAILIIGLLLGYITGRSSVKPIMYHDFDFEDVQQDKGLFPYPFSQKEKFSRDLVLQAIVIRERLRGRINMDLGNGPPIFVPDDQEPLYLLQDTLGEIEKLVGTLQKQQRNRKVSRLVRTPVPVPVLASITPSNPDIGELRFVDCDVLVKKQIGINGGLLNALSCNGEVEANLNLIFPTVTAATTPLRILEDQNEVLRWYIWERVWLPHRHELQEK